MKYTEANLGRIFILRLEQDDIIPDVFEKFALEKGIKSAIVSFLGGADKDSRIIVGPKAGTEYIKPAPMVTSLSGVSEAVGMGTIFTNQEGVPKLHMHAAFGRDGEVKAGCTRAGVRIWHIGEAVVMELLNCPAQRRINPQSGFELLEIE